MYISSMQFAAAPAAMLAAKAQRVQQELTSVGVTVYGRAKFSSHILPSILQEDEHIGGAIYGRYSTDDNVMKWNEGMLVATDKRIIFLDYKPGFEAVDELTYDVVNGMQKVYAWPFASFTLHTKIGNYTLRYVNKRCVDTFMDYVESYRQQLNKLTTTERRQ